MVDGNEGNMYVWNVAEQLRKDFKGQEAWSLWQ